jgi:hypothetical protein
VSENNYPYICREVGLSCEECTGSTASQVALLCTGLRGKAVKQLFVQLYPHPACAGMQGHFAAAYQAAGDRQAVRKGPSRAFQNLAAAVA